MNIIQANKYYYPRGGADRYALDLSELLEEHGHSVVPFAMDHPKNLPTPWSRYFPSFVETESVSLSLKGLKTFTRMIYSREARCKMAALIDKTRPDLCHAHNIYTQLSPSILDALRERVVPTVMSVHDYHLIAPNYMLFSHGKIEDWSKTGIIRAALSRYHKGSLAASFAQSLMYKIHQWRHSYERGVDYFICPSEFVREQLITHGFPAERIVTVPLPQDTSDIPVKTGDEGYFLFAGRLVPEKGVEVLIRAMAGLPGIKCKILGSGPDEARLKEWARDLPNVEFLPWQSGGPPYDLYAAARAVVVPSIWYECFGLVALEAMAAGTAVIASDIGGLPEVVRDGRTGRLFPPGDVQALRAIISDLHHHPELAAEYGRTARKVVEQEHNLEKHYQEVMKVYGLARKRK